MTVLSVDIPVLTTERLILREPRQADFPAHAEFAASDRAKFVGGSPDRFEAWRGFTSGIGHWILKGFGFWTVEDRATGAPAGRVGLLDHEGWPEIELGWHIYAGFEGKSYAYEAAMAARDHAYRVMGLPPMISHIDPDNARSRRLAERMGAVIERESVLLGQPVLIYRHPAGAA
ncbi:GNAT family N-acetyltransferase [Paracoccus sp. M683]|uniref:GNAT family N-acetyltransferase n=1 Tax=Paracoccus sp. M683 TaxID=2594268 RepID=UPI00117EAAAD|nr:GNAT family N-acetyltransferase [Paracoccus sp. M683]TRW97566.1 GNAT family N-acetyltransferase [Paracoccus sp. M683]